MSHIAKQTDLLLLLRPAAAARTCCCCSDVLLGRGCCMRQTCVPCSNKARTLLALQHSTDVQNVRDEAEVGGAEEALFYIDEGGAFGRSATTSVIQSIKMLHGLTGTAGTEHNKTRHAVWLLDVLQHSCLCAGAGRLTMLSTPWLKRQIDKGQTYRSQQQYNTQDAVMKIAAMMTSRPADPRCLLVDASQVMLGLPLCGKS